jgi:hypothetical protein
MTFGKILSATILVASLAPAGAGAALAKGPGPNLSPSMGAMSSMRMDFSMRAPNALRNTDAERPGASERKIKRATRITGAGRIVARAPAPPKKPAFTVTPAAPAQQVMAPVTYPEPKPAEPKDESKNPSDNPDLAALRRLLGWLPSGPPGSNNDDGEDSNGSLPQFPQFGGPQPTPEQIRAWMRSKTPYWWLYSGILFFIPPEQGEAQRTGPQVTDNPTNPLAAHAQPETSALPAPEPIPGL